MKKKVKIFGWIALGLVILFTAYIFYPSTYKGSDKIILMDNQDLNSLDDIIKMDYFKDKVVFIDIWGTYCDTCLNEFDSVKQLKERYKNQPVEFLYLCSISRMDQEMKWKKIIQEKNLEGYHIAINNQQYYNIWETMKDNVDQMYSIPHYLIAKNGKVIIYKSSAPSSGEKLYSELDSVLNMN